MQIRARLLLAVLIGLLAGCGEKAAPYKPKDLPSGRVVKIQSFDPEYLFTGERAAVLKFIPDASLDDDVALDAEVALLWKELALEAWLESQGERLVLIRAISDEVNGWDPGKQRQYVYRLQPDGTWRMERDPEVRLR